MSQKIIRTIAGDSISHAPRQAATLNSAAPYIEKNSKVSLFDFGLVQLPAPQQVDIQGHQVSIHSLIPYEQVLDAVQWAINYILDDRTFISAPLNAIIGDIAIVKYWSDIDCTEIDSIDFDARKCYELYDALQHFGIISKVLEHTNEKQIMFFRNNLRDTLTSLVAYRNSAAGVLEQLHMQNNQEQNNLNSIMETLQDPEQTGLMHKVLDLFGGEAGAAMPETTIATIPKGE